MDEKQEDPIIGQLDRAKKTGQWMIAIWRIDDGKIHLDRTATSFPKTDVTEAMRMIVTDTEELKG